MFSLWTSPEKGVPGEDPAILAGILFTAREQAPNNARLALPQKSSEQLGAACAIFELTLLVARPGGYLQRIMGYFGV